MEPCKSEIARRLEQIRLEYESAQRGLVGFSKGVARHMFISASEHLPDDPPLHEPGQH